MSLHGNEWRERGYGLTMKEFAKRTRNGYVVIKYMTMILATPPPVLCLLIRGHKFNDDVTVNSFVL
jgi:hypothetical protein